MCMKQKQLCKSNRLIDAAARDGDPHALWGGHGHKHQRRLPMVMAM